MGKFDNYQFRCSALGHIMSAKGDLTVGNKTYLKELFIGEMYGIRKEVTSKYFEKGMFMEEDGIDLLNKSIYPDNILIKNKERKSNNFIHGEMDTMSPDKIVYDIKNAWDKFSFGKAELTFNYEWQLRGYMWLWECDKARLFYCLNNMPEHLLCDEERKLFYKNGYTSYENEEYQTLCEELRAKHNYDSMELWERFKVWDVEHSDAEIEKLKAKVTKCRAYLNELCEENDTLFARNKNLMGIEPSILLAHHDSEVGATIVE